MQGALDPRTESMLFGKLDSHFYMVDGLDLGNVDQDESLVTRNGRIVIDITIVITIFPGEVMVCTRLVVTPKVTRPVLLKRLALSFIQVGLVAHISRRSCSNQRAVKSLVQRVPFRVRRPTGLRISARLSIAVIVGPTYSKDVADEKDGRKIFHTDSGVYDVLGIVQIEHP